MFKRSTLALAALILFTAAFAHAQAPAGATGVCKDGTYSNAASKDGACRGHKGVQTWYAATPAKPAAGTTTKPAAAPAPAAKPAAKPAAPAPMASGAAPAGASGQCNDGTYSNAASKSGACGGHKGVKTWFSAAPTPSPASKPAPVPAPMAAAPAARPAPAPTPAPASRPATQPAPTQPAAGGGPGQVWVNTETKVYHCSGDRYYGKTKKGTYMSQSDAQSKGFRPDAGKACPN